MENPFYRDNLEAILTHFGNKHYLSVREVGAYAGMKDPRTVRRHFPYFVGGYISAETLAKCLAGSPPKRGRRS